MSTEHSVSRLLVGFAPALLVGVLALAPASAQNYPQRAVRFILPFGPASGVDTTARLLGDRLAARWGKPVVIENRPGGDGLVAINAFTSANDDHTLLFVPASTLRISESGHQLARGGTSRPIITRGDSRWVRTSCPKTSTIIAAAFLAPRPWRLPPSSSA